MFFFPFSEEERKEERIRIMNGMKTKKMKRREKKKKEQRAHACMSLSGVSSGEERGGEVTIILLSSHSNAIILGLTKSRK